MDYDFMKQATMLFNPEQKKKEWYEEIEEEVCGYCPKLSYQSRIMGCISMMILGFFISMGSLLRLVKLLEGHPTSFATMYTLGNIVSISATCFLYGPWSQAKKMFAQTRIFATCIYFFFMGMCLFLAFFPHTIPYRALWLILAVLCQFLALSWYTLSFIPYARDLAKNCIASVCCSWCGSSQRFLRLMRSASKFTRSNKLLKYPGTGRSKSSSRLNLGDIDENEFDTLTELEVLTTSNHEAREDNERYDLQRMQRSFQLSCGAHPKFPYYTLFVTLLTWFFFLYGAIGVLNVPVTLKTPVSMPPAEYQFQTVKPWPLCDDSRGQVWRLLSFQFVHEGLNHIGGNTMTGLAFGVFLESALPGTILFSMLFTAFVYQCGIILGALSWAYVSPYGVGLVGCSSGVFALIGAGLSNIIVNFKSMNPVLIYIHLMAATCVLGISGAGFLFRYDSSTAYESHATGLIVGFLIGTTTGVFRREENDSPLRHETATSYFFNWTTCMRDVNLKWRFCTGLAGICSFLVLVVVVSYNYAHTWPPREPSWRPTFHSQSPQSCCALLYSVVDQYSSFEEARREFVCDER